MGRLTDEMKRVVDEQRLGFVATVCPDGTPNLSPKGTTAVWDDEHLVFADIRSPITVKNLRQNPAVEINVVDPISRKGFRFKGMATVINSGPLFDEVLEFFKRERGLVQMQVQTFVLVEVKQARPLISPAYDLGASEEEVSDQWTAYFAALRHGTRPAETVSD